MATSTVAAAAKMTSTTAVAVSLTLTTLAVANAFHQKKQFYPAVVYICKSNPSMAAMYMQALVAVYLLGKLIGKIFFGTLRAAESERLIEKAWYAVTETCLAFTIFKDDLSPKFVALFTLLLFLKCFHWLVEDRVDYMERTPVISYLFHIRIWLLLTLLTLSDIYFVHDAYTTTMAKGPSVQLVFGFEYALLVTLAANAAFKYILHAVDVYSDTFWESKAVLLLYLEFVIGLCKAVMYMIFLTIMVRTYTIPLFAFRPMYHTVRNFKKVFQDLILSRRAIHNMNTLYPDATAQDLIDIENVCIICREDMTATAAKKLPCNHIFHTSCLRSWFQRHQTCPTCRLDILHPTTNVTPTMPTPRAAQAPTTVPGNVRPTTDTNRPGSFTGNGPSGSQTGISDNNQMPHNFRPFTCQRPAFNDENNANNNDPNPNNSQPQHNINDFIEMLNSSAFGTENSSPLPSFINDAQQPNFMPSIPLNFPFVGGIAIQHPHLPPNLDAISDDELRHLEQNTRQACVDRLKFLNDIKCMLDSAALLMNHYNSAYLISGVDKSDTFTDTVKTSGATENDEQSETRPPSNISSEADSSISDTSRSGGITSSSNGSDNQPPQEETEQQRVIRLKRLEKFSDIGNNST